MSFLSKVELKKQLRDMGIKVEGNYVRKKDIERVTASHISETEKGNTLLTNESDFVAWLKLSSNEMLEIAWNPDNYPALAVNSTNLSEKELVDHINENLIGWHVRKANMEGLNIENNEIVAKD